MINLLLDDIEKPNWAEIKENQKSILNDYVLAVLMNNKEKLKLALSYMANDADRRNHDYLLEEFDIESEKLAERRIEEASAFINAYIINGLPSGKNAGTVERVFQEIIDNVKQADSDGVSLDKESIKTITLETIGKGLNSGYIDKTGVDWNLDRLTKDIGSHVYKETYFEASKLIDTELVKVYKFVNPRLACQKLEASGIIGIKPRSQMSEENQKYPNVWDAEHKYLEPDGHHGYNCRHVWHNIKSQVNRTNDL